MILLTAVVVGAAVYGYKQMDAVATYVAATTVEANVSSCSSPGLCSVSVYDSEQYVPTAANLIRSPRAARLASSRLHAKVGGATAGDILSMTTAAPIPNTQLLRITASSSNPRMAWLVANAMTLAGVSVLNQDLRESNLQSLDNLRHNLAKQLALLNRLEEHSTAGNRSEISNLKASIAAKRQLLDNLVSNSTVPPISVSVATLASGSGSALPNRAFRTAFAAALAVVLGLLVLVFVRDYLIEQQVFVAPTRPSHE